MREVHGTVLARAKRERVVQDEVQKANRRPTDPTDTARHPSLFLWKLTIFDETPFLKMDHFRRKFVKSGRTPHLKTGHFRRKLVNVCEIEAHSSCENLPFSTEIGENWWNWGALLFWKLTIFDEIWWKLVKICELEAHVFFWKLTLFVASQGSMTSKRRFEGWNHWNNSSTFTVH